MHGWTAAGRHSILVGLVAWGTAMNRRNSIVLFVLSAVVIIGILTVVSGSHDRVNQLRVQLSGLKTIVAAYQMEEQEAPSSNEDLLSYTDQAREYLIDPWQPDRLLDLQYDVDGAIVRFENDAATARIERDLSVVVSEKN